MAIRQVVLPGYQLHYKQHPYYLLGEGSQFNPSSNQEVPLDSLTEGRPAHYSEDTALTLLISLSLVPRLEGIMVVQTPDSRRPLPGTQFGDPLMVYVSLDPTRDQRTPARAVRPKYGEAGWCTPATIADGQGGTWDIPRFTPVSAEQAVACYRRLLAS